MDCPLVCCHGDCPVSLVAGVHNQDQDTGLFYVELVIDFFFFLGIMFTKYELQRFGGIYNDTVVCSINS